MQPTPFSDPPPLRDRRPPWEEDAPIALFEPIEASCALCEADDGYVCPVHGSLILELL